VSPTKHEDDTAKEAIKPDFLQELGISPEEQQGMEDAAYSGAAEDIASNAGLTSSEILDLEDNPTDSNPESATDTVETDAIPFRKEGDPEGEDSGPKNLRSRVKNLSRRAKVGIAGGILTGGVGIASFFGLGSFTAIHLLQVLTPDFTPGEETSDIRMNALYRYARSGGNLAETRVSYLGSRKFNATQADLEKIGVTLNTNKKFGVNKGLIIEANKFPVTEGLPKDKIPGALEKYFNEGQRKPRISAANIEVQGNNVFIKGAEGDRLSIAARRALFDKSVAQLDGGGISKWFKARALKKAYGLPSMFHPFKALDAKITEKIESKYAAKQEAKRKEKERKTGITEPSEEGKTAYRKLQESTSKTRAIGGSALLITAAACVAKEAYADAIVYNREAVVLPQAFQAADAMAVGAQQMAGQDFRTSQLDAFNKLLADDDGKSIWQAKALQAKTDPNGATGEDLPDKYAQAFESSGDASSLKEIGSKATDVACSPGGQAAQAAAGLLLLAFSVPTGGVSAVVYGGVKMAASTAGTFIGLNALSDLVRSATEDAAIPDDVSATVKGNLLAYGSRELANTTARMSGGVELSAEESAMIDRKAAAQSEAEFQSKPFLAKVFDPKESKSVTGKAIDSYGPPGQEIQNVARGFLNIGPMFANIFKGFAPKAHAATTYDYGFPRYGIPQRLLNNPAYDDPYANGDAVAGLLKDGQHQDYIDRAKKCFNVTISNDSGVWGVEPGEGDVNPKSEDYQGAHCNDSSNPDWDRIILFVSDSLDMEAAACWLGEDDSCEVLGVDPGDVEEGGDSFGVKVASFNILHSPDGDVPERLGNAVKTLLHPPNGAPAVDVAGLQEVRKDQLTLLKNKKYPGSDQNNLDGYDMFPDTTENPLYQPNIIIWKKDKYTALSKDFIDAQYFHGDEEQFPVIKFKDNASGKSFYFMDIHSPRSGNGRGDNAGIRDSNARKFQAYFADIKHREPDVAIILVGDFNAGYQAPGPNQTIDDVVKGRRAFCILTNGIFWDSWHASKHIDEKCPRGSGVSYVDHIFVDRDTEVSKYFVAARQVGGSGNNGSDHNTIFANIGIAGTGGGVDGWSWPLKKDINNGPCYGGSSVHAGMDMNSKTDNNIVYAMHSGKVVRRGYDADGAGNYITIKADAPFNNNEVYYSYEHLKVGSIGVNVGDTVAGGQEIGIAGLTGNVEVSSSAAHLHIVTATTNSLGAYGNLGTTFDPMKILSKAGPAPEGYQCYAN
jgi:hypothetical protein